MADILHAQRDTFVAEKASALAACFALMRVRATAHTDAVLRASLDPMLDDVAKQQRLRGALRYG
jgi:hypothetical protein